MSKEKTRKKWGDRRDGKRVKMPAMLTLLTHLSKRTEAYVYMNKKLDVTELVKYMKKKKEKNSDLTYFHAFSMAIAKVIYNRPRLNYFIMNNKCYERNDVILSFVARVTFEDGGKEVMSLIKVDPNETIESLGNKIKEKVNKFRNQKEQTSTDDSMDFLGKLPNWLLKFIIAPGAKWMDRHDLLPKSLTNELIYNSTVLLSNLGSIKCGAIHHHLLDFGTNSIITTIGDIHKEAIVINDKVEIRDVVEFGITIDERIADGVYFAKAINLLDYIMAHPETLEDRADEIYEEKENFKY